MNMKYSEYIYYAGTTQPIVRAFATIYNNATLNLTPLYDVNGDPIANPQRTADDGLLEFYTEPGTYDLWMNGKKQATIYNDGSQNWAILAEASATAAAGSAAAALVSETNAAASEAAAQAAAASSYLVSSYANLDTAIATINTTPATLIINAATTLVDNKTVPSTLTIRVQQGGSIALTSGKVLTISGQFEAPLMTVFSGAGTVTFSNGQTVNPYWWGATATGDLLAPMQKAAAAATNIDVPYSTGYTLSNTLTLTDKAVNFNGSIITYTGAANSWAIVATMGLTTPIYSTGIENFRLFCQSTDTVNVRHGICLGWTGYCRDFQLNGFTGISLALGSGVENKTGVTLPASQKCYYYNISNGSIKPWGAGYGIVIQKQNSANNFTNISTLIFNATGGATATVTTCTHDMVINGRGNTFTRVSLESTPSAERIVFMDDAGTSANHNRFDGLYMEWNDGYNTPYVPVVTAQLLTAFNEVSNFYLEPDTRIAQTNLNAINDLGTANKLAVLPSNYINGPQIMSPLTSSNLIHNGTFTGGSSIGWSNFSTGGTTLSYDPVGGIVGGGSITLTCVNGRPNFSQDITALTGIPIANLKGKNITLGAWIKTDLATVLMRCAGFNQGIVPNDGAWHYVTTTINIPTAATAVACAILTNTGGDTYNGYITISNVTAVIGTEPLAAANPMFDKTVAIGTADTTPSVAGGTRFSSAGTQTITNFDDGKDGQEITIVFSAATVIQSGSAIRLAGATNFTATTNDCIKLVNDGTRWYEVSRSVN